MATPTDPHGADADGIDIASASARLDELRRRSEERTAELREIAAALPAVVGRRAMLRSLVGDTLANPNKPEIARRGLGRARRVPRQALNAVIARLRRRPVGP